MISSSILNITCKYVYSLFAFQGAITGLICGEIVGISLAVTGMVNSIDAPILEIGYCGLYPPMYPELNVTGDATTAGFTNMSMTHMRYRRNAEEYEDFYDEK